MIEFTCSECGKKLKVAHDVSGKRGKCPQCGATLLVPQAELVSIEAADPSPTTPARPVVHATRRLVPTPPAVPSPQRRKHRLWLALLLVAAVIAAPFAPKFPFWFGIVLLVLCVATFVPSVQALSRRLLRLNPAEKWRSGIRLTMYGLIALVLILAGSTGAGYKAEQTRIAAQQAAEEAEQRRLTNEANAQVVALVREAEVAWKDGDSALAEKKLEAASRIPNATELATIRRLHNRMANAKVDALVAEATKAVKAGDIDAASKKVQAALAVPHADNLPEPRRLDQQIRNATDPARIRAALMELPDKAFLQLEENGAIPEQLLSGYEGLDSRTAALAKAQLAGVGVAREQRRQEQLDRERTAAETARKAEEERKGRAAAADQAKADAEAAEKARYEKGMGETLSIGYTSYVVWRAHWSGRLSSNQFLDKRPNAKWLFVEVSVRNNDKKARMIPPFKLVDQHGREYESSAEATMIDNAIGVLDSLNPDVTKQGYVIFDVPPNRTYKLKLSGGYWSGETGYIRIEPRDKP